MASPFYHLPASLPIVWTSATSLQVGIDPPIARVDHVPDDAAPLLHALTAGTPASGVRMIAKTHRISDTWVDHLLAVLQPALNHPAPPPAPTWSVWSTSEAVAGLRPLAHHSGVTLEVAPEVGPDTIPPTDEVLVVADYLVHPHWVTYLLRRGITHCPIIFSDQTVSVGPLMRVGVGPCLVCVESHRRSATPEWLEVSSQLWGRVSPLHYPDSHGVTWMLIMAVMTGFTDKNSSPDFSRAVWHAATRDITWERVDFHPDCTCRGATID